MIDDRRTKATEFPDDAKEQVLRVVLELLESDGYDAVQLRVVAKRARVSLTTIYKFFARRNDLIVAALARWMEVNAYAHMADPPPHATLYDRMVWVHGQLFEPWVRNPRMLEAYHRALNAPGGERLDLQGMAVVEPAVRPLLDAVDPIYAKDIELVMSNMVWGVIQRCAVGDLPVHDILPLLERTLFRLTTNNEPLSDTGTDRRKRAKRPGEA